MGKYEVEARITEARPKTGERALVARRRVECSDELERETEVARSYAWFYENLLKVGQRFTLTVERK